ncbi:hypothetical protein [Deinococcus roseus]|uniref:GW domain-containing protein n=1 Tax=Deinococcus roseus TaxID=392414 RepID=A0ABQ2CTC8_9DEIO|nr:hypothetical protein [Deinococcus roseus]GGJ18979.1 hypothetical protein GCM10008938_01240 [Deinococcus roseus]
MSKRTLNTALKLLFCTLLMGSSIGIAEPIKLPEGWQAKQDGNQWILQPSGLQGQQVFQLVVYRDVDLQGKDLQVYLKNFMQQNSAKYGKVLQQGEVQDQSTLLLGSVAVQARGQTLTLLYTAFPAGEGRGQVALMVSSQDQSLLDKYAAQAGKVLGNVVGLYESNRAQLNYAGELPAGAKLGGKVQEGTYKCTQHFSSIEPGHYSVSMYANGEWRLGDDTGNYQYNPKTGQIDISVLHNLYNSDYRPEEFTLYYLDKNNVGNIMSNMGISPTTCVLAGKNQEISPAEEARKQAEKEAEEAEARRFKWYTAPGKGLQMNQIEAIYLHYRQQYNYNSMLYDYIEDFNLLLKDGWMYSHLVVSPADLDVPASRKNEPKTWFKWKRQGEDIVYLDGKEWRKLEGTPVKPAAKGEKIQGSFLYLSNNSNMVTGGSVYKEYYHFDSKGGFAISSSSSLFAGGMPGYSGYSTSYTNQDGTISSFAAGTPNGAAGGGSDNNNPNNDLAGTYTLDGYTLQLKTLSGKVVRKLFFFPGSKKDQVVIDGLTYWIPSD